MGPKNQIHCNHFERAASKPTPIRAKGCERTGAALFEIRKYRRHYFLDRFRSFFNSLFARVVCATFHFRLFMLPLGQRNSRTRITLLLPVRGEAPQAVWAGALFLLGCSRAPLQSRRFRVL